ncbi:G-type lectin S-receptor-like serine/threonine-protein kinase SD2-5 [Bidens hawaiensis]|uniref:G-type lectin S-receptor-like serine/threonine-protein kinase SD2-5 n=1 Tax=Bidens hawaiensis TaxID=980011 RepID=UPI00404B7231
MLCCYSATAESYRPIANANLSTTWTTKYSYDQPMLLRKANAAQFTCGFFIKDEDEDEDEEPTVYFFGILISPTEGSWLDNGVEIWSTSQGYPLKENATLNFTSAGDLVLSDADGSIVWSTNTSGKAVAGMNLIHTGNLVFFDDQNSVVWQSFDHPADCLVPGQKLFQGQKLKSNDLTSNHDLDGCDYPLVCGRNSICSGNKQCSCLAIEYFRPVNDRQPFLGCSAITPLTCNSTQDQHFITLQNVSYFRLEPDMKGVNMETCKQACLNSCTCKAAFFRYYSYDSRGECILRSDIYTMQSVDPLYNNDSAFIKVQNVTSPPLSPQGTSLVCSNNPSSPQVARVVGSAIGSIVLLLFVAIGFIVYVVHKKKRDTEMEEEYLAQVPGMPTRFSYEELKTATKNFSKKLGEGGYGSVFEGILGDGTKIALKCLEGQAHVKKSFLAEVQSIGSIHHVNLVRLRGFCTWKSQRFLVYDFMNNGSLDRWIYHGNHEHILDWECRKKIILDIAKGLAYLHEECRQKIIHLDIKPQNILLDDNFNAKVSDFGLSKLIDRNQSQVMTTMRGTPGYLAPEWLSSVITEKVDVYSFRIVLLEILCGRKNFDWTFPEKSWHLLRVFQNCWEQEKLIDMVDMSGEDMHKNGTEIMEMMKLASWCLQTDYTRRPSMSSVVKELEGGMEVESNLAYNFTDPRLPKNNSHEKDLTLLLPSVLSGPR